MDDEARERRKFARRFESPEEAREFELKVLRTYDNRYIPDFVRQVRDGGKATEEYWPWLYGQAEEWTSENYNDSVRRVARLRREARERNK